MLFFLAKTKDEKLQCVINEEEPILKQLSISAVLINSPYSLI